MTRAFALRAAILFIGVLPFWNNQLGWWLPTRDIFQRAPAWVHAHVFQRAGFDLSRLVVPDVAEKLELILAGGLLWTLLDRRRRHDHALRDVLTIGARYAVGVVMIAFGLCKVIPLQFSPLSPAEMIQPIAESDTSAWTMTGRLLGASVAYQMFTGWAEVIAGALLFSRQTTALGTLIVLGQVSGVFAMTSDTMNPRGTNFNWYAGIPLLAAGILAATCWRPLVDVFILRRPTEAIAPGVSRGFRRIETAGRVLAILASLYVVRGMVNQWLVRQARSPLDGLYAVERYNGAGIDDPGKHWRVVALEACVRLVARTIDNTPIEYRVVVPTPSRQACAVAMSARVGRLVLRRSSTTTEIRYARDDDRMLSLAGVLDGVPLDVQLRRTDGQ